MVRQHDNMIIWWGWCKEKMLWLVCLRDHGRSEANDLSSCGDLSQKMNGSIPLMAWWAENLLVGPTAQFFIFFQMFHEAQVLPKFFPVLTEAAKSARPPTWVLHVKVKGISVSTITDIKRDQKRWKLMTFDVSLCKISGRVSHLFFFQGKSETTASTEATPISATKMPCDISREIKSCFFHRHVWIKSFFEMSCLLFRCCRVINVSTFCSGWPGGTCSVFGGLGSPTSLETWRSWCEYSLEFLENRKSAWKTLFFLGGWTNSWKGLKRCMFSFFWVMTISGQSKECTLRPNSSSWWPRWA